MAESKTKDKAAEATRCPSCGREREASEQFQEADKQTGLRDPKTVPGDEVERCPCGYVYERVPTETPE